MKRQANVCSMGGGEIFYVYQRHSQGSCLSCCILKRHDIRAFSGL